MIPLDEAVDQPAAGHKAAMLARARAAGLPVPDGVVLLPGEALDRQALAEALVRLGGDRFAVRSSADVEDRPGASAAGIFESVVAVPRAEVPAAIERVRASATSSGAQRYLESRGCAAATLAVLVQPMVRAERLGVLHTEPRINDAMPAEERAPDEPEWGCVEPRRIPPGDPLALGAARLAALTRGAADIEYALTAEGPIFLQARPLTPLVRSSASRWDPGDSLAWERDVEHNPLPLSAAQTSLVALVEGVGGLRQRVIHGYLFSRREASARPRIAPADLSRAFHDDLLPACDELLAPFEAREPQDLDLGEVQRAYRFVLERYLGDIGPSIAKASAELDSLLHQALGEPLDAHANLLAGVGGFTVERDQALWQIGRASAGERPALVGDYHRRFGAYAPVWDVLCETDEEAPARLRAMAELVSRGAAPRDRHALAVRAADAARDALCRRVDRSTRDALCATLPTVRAARMVAEQDDALFFRAQRLVRRALLVLGRSAAERAVWTDPSLVFELPIGASLDGDAARAKRAERLTQARLDPPLAVRGGVPLPAGGADRAVLHGIGTAGAAGGRAFVVRNPAARPDRLPDGAVLIAPAILPSLAYLIAGAAALVTDYGGALSHGATLAREYGVPAVLSTGRATTVIADGERLWVDAGSGRVYRLG